MHLLEAEEVLLGPDGSELSLGMAVVIGAFPQVVLLERYVHNGRRQQKVNRNGERKL
jgi:hypothetical protein